MDKHKHKFEPGGIYPELCIARLLVENRIVFCGLHVKDGIHAGISDRAAAALADVAELRNAIVGSEASGSDVTHMLRRLDRIEQALRADGGA